MKKLFTLLTLLVAMVTSAWAESTVDDLTSITAATTITMDGINSTNALADKTLYAENKLLCLGGCGYSTSKGSTTYNEVEYKNVYQIKDSRQIALKIGFKATITIVGSSHSSRKWRLGTSSAGKEVAESDNNATTLTANVDGSSEAKVIYINATSDLYLGAIIITANESTSPAISATSPVSIKARKSGVEVTEEIPVTGEYLTGSTLTASLSPAVTGLSVTLSSSTITSGEISTTATLHYTQTENASGSTTLTLSDGTTKKDVVVNYTSKVVKKELAAISSTEKTTMDLSKVGTSGMETLTVDDGYVVLTDAGATTAFADNLAVSCIDGVGITWRSDAVQGPLFKFKTTVPGTVTVKFSDVGSSGGRANRYANVNGTRTDVYTTTSASSGVVTCSPILVDAGEVVIKGQVKGDGDTYTDNQIRVFTIEFTPAAASVSVPVGATGWSTYSSDQILDFGNAEDGIEAYMITGFSGTAVTTSKVTGIVPASTGLLVKGATASTSYSVPIATTADVDVTGNKLVAAVTGATVSAGEGTTVNYVLVNNEGTAEFQWIGSTSATLGANKAYLSLVDGPKGGAGSRGLTIDFDDATGIDSVTREALTNGKVYNLQGQEVRNAKGIVIVNGKKVIMK